MKKFTVKITEEYTRTVVVRAEDEEDAFEKADYLCSEGTIDINFDHFSSRSCEVLHEATEMEKTLYDTFDTDDE